MSYLIVFWSCPAEHDRWSSAVLKTGKVWIGKSSIIFYIIFHFNNKANWKLSLDGIIVDIWKLSIQPLASWSCRRKHRPFFVSETASWAWSSGSSSHREPSNRSVSVFVLSPSFYVYHGCWVLINTIKLPYWIERLARCVFSAGSGRNRSHESEWLGNFLSADWTMAGRSSLNLTPHRPGLFTSTESIKRMN